MTCVVDGAPFGTLPTFRNRAGDVLRKQRGNSYAPLPPPGDKERVNKKEPEKKRNHRNRKKIGRGDDDDSDDEQKVSTTEIRDIDSLGLAAMLDLLASKPLPDANSVFPWFHGLHPRNRIQQAFFVARRKTRRKAPKCLSGITLVKAGGDLSCAVLKGALAPDEFLDESQGFLDIDPVEGFSVRNFQLQAAKMATVSDIIVYGDKNSTSQDLQTLAGRIVVAQNLAGAQYSDESDRLTFNTYVLSTPFSYIEEHHPNLVEVDSKGNNTGNVTNFLMLERQEMYKMSAATEIAKNVWLGPTPDEYLDAVQCNLTNRSFDILVEASDDALIPDEGQLQVGTDLISHSPPPLNLRFPSSGSLMPTGVKSNELIRFLKWIHEVANPPRSEAICPGGDSLMIASTKPRRVLIHCADGYTETSLLAWAYMMYAYDIPLHEAWLQLHREKSRNFFAYPSDVACLHSMETEILSQSPNRPHVSTCVGEQPPKWCHRMDGSFPNRILHYMYLGQLDHANNRELLTELGISQLISIESTDWQQEDIDGWGQDNILRIENVQDNGVDSLTGEFDRCLDFIERGRLKGTATLIHCRVGVSRSAVICIAEVMKSQNLSFVHAYVFVRARRLNKIIQPHLRFSYELLKWEETLAQRRGKSFKRELEWPTIARAITFMNAPYMISNVASEVSGREVTDADEADKQLSVSLPAKPNSPS